MSRYTSMVASLSSLVFSTATTQPDLSCILRWFRHRAQATQGLVGYLEQMNEWAGRRGG
jgi:hypothetical protein